MMFIKVTPDCKRMVLINSNRTIIVYDFATSKAEQKQVVNQPVMLAMVPGSELMMTSDQVDGMKVYDSITLEEMPLL